MLNFDPHKWIAEHGQASTGLAGLAGLAGSTSENENGAVNAKSQGLPANPAKVANRAERQRILDHWCDAFNVLDPCQPAPGFEMGRWQTLYDTSHWWLENFARQAVRDGWGTGDVFGIRPGYEARGGLIDQLGDCRSLIMGEGRARWRDWGTIRHYSCGAYPHLQPFWKGNQ